MSDRKKNDSGTSQFNFKKSNYQKFDLNNLPKGWINVPMSQIACLINGRAFKPENWSSEGLPIVRIQNLNDHTKPFNYCNFEVDKKFCIDDGQILFAWSGTPKTSFGCFIWNRGKAILNQHIFRVEIDEKYLNKQFICYAINQNLDKYISKAHGGVGLRHITKGKFEEESVFLPPFNEQKRIVAKIESIFSRIDVASGDLERIKTLLKQAKQSVLKSAFEGRLIVHDVDDKPKDFLKRISEHSNRELIFDKGDLPKGWIRAELGGLCDLIGGGTPSRKNPEYFGGNIIWLTPTEIPKEQIVKIKDSKERITQLGLKKSSAKMIPDGAVLLTSRASIGYVAISGTLVTTNQGFASFVCNKTIHNYFLAYWLYGNKDLLKSIATGTTFKEISKRKIRGLFIPLPPLNEQKRIVAKIESIFGRIDLVLTCVRHNVRIFRLHFYSFLICSIV